LPAGKVTGEVEAVVAASFTARTAAAALRAGASADSGILSRT